MENVRIGIIGGVVCTTWPRWWNRTEVTLTTPFGNPIRPVRHRHAARQARGVSGAPRRRPPAAAGGVELPRHIFGMKQLGVEYILSASASAA
jgi:purine nucleoside phosphorylase